MKRKFLILTLMFSFSISIVACGQSNTEIQTDVEATTTIEETELEETTEESTTLEEPLIEETENEEIVEEVVEEFTIDTAGVKVASIMDAYIEITNIENTDNYACIGRTEYSTVSDGYTIESKTSDGFDLNEHSNEAFTKSELACMNIYLMYLYDYVNKDSKITNFNEYISNNTLDDLFYSYGTKEYMDKVFEESEYIYDEYLMIHAAKFLPLVAQITAGEGKSMEVKDLITEGFAVESVSGIPVAYEVSLYFDGEFGGINVGFDADGNMLNFFYKEDGFVDSYGGYTYTFE